VKCSVLYEDQWICVAIKPPGMFVHPSALDRGVSDCVTELEAEKGRRVYNVHRIDRPASGLVVFALDRESAANLSAQFRDRSVHKHYLAVVRGHVTENIMIDEPISGHRNAPAVPAITRVTPLSQSVVPAPVGKFDEAWFSLVLAEIETGRPHQVRRHLKRVGHPVIGDTQHGDTAQNHFAETRTGIRRLALLSYRLQFAHPHDGKTVGYCSGIPDWWETYLAALGLEMPEGI